MTGSKPGLELTAYGDRANTDPTESLGGAMFRFIKFGATAIGLLAIIWLVSPDVRLAEATLPPIGEVAVDIDPSGNTATSLGPTDNCNVSPISVGQTFQVDVVIKDVPAPGLGGYGFNLRFNPAVLKVTDLLPSYFLVSTPPPRGQLTHIDSDATNDDTIEALPGVTGNVRIDTIEIPAGPPDTGSGVLVRWILEAVGTGTSALAVESPILMDVTGADLGPPAQNKQATVRVGGICEPLGPPATALILLDAIPESNGARYVGPVESCREVGVGESFSVDLVVPHPGIQTTAGIAEALFTYIATSNLAIEGFDHRFLLGGATGSSIVLVTDGVGIGGVGPVQQVTIKDTGLPRRPEPAGVSEVGRGVVARIHLKALAPGQSRLFVSNNDFNSIIQTFSLTDQYGRSMNTNRVQPITIMVGGECAPFAPYAPPVGGGVEMLSSAPAGHSEARSAVAGVAAAIVLFLGLTVAGFTVRRIARSRL